MDVVNLSLSPIEYISPVLAIPKGSVSPEQMGFQITSTAKIQYQEFQILDWRVCCSLFPAYMITATELLEGKTKSAHAWLAGCQ